MIFEISHRTHYSYSAPVVQSQHLFHLSPRAVSTQIVHRHAILIDPAPAQRHDRVDAFGNPVVQLDVEVPHDNFIVHARTKIEIQQQPSIDLDRSMPWDDVQFDSAVQRNPDNLDITAHRCPTDFTGVTADIADYARQCFTPGRPVLAAANDLTRRMFRDFKFDPAATDVSTPVAEVFRTRRGVCQDFAHLALACCKSVRVPTRYVSGYLLTLPPPGQAKCVGADASHAWISIWSPEFGWCDFDPTNGMLVGGDHIAFAVGRDYGDVSPISGILVGGGAHKVDVAVDVAVA